MGQLEKLETTLDESLRKKAPVTIPPAPRKMIAHALWWIVIILGILELYTAIELWQWGHQADVVISTVNYYTGTSVRHLGLFYYLSLIAMTSVGVLMLLAAPALKAMKKSGWNLLFYVVLLEAGVAVLQLFADGQGFFAFLSGALGALLGAYLVFQVREYFVGARHTD